MPPKKLTKSKMGFFGVRAKPSGHFGVKFIYVGHHFWLGTYPMADKAADAYDMAMWHARRLETDLNFPKIKTRAGVEFLVQEGIQMEEIPKKTKKRPTIVVGLGNSDKAAMARFAREHVQTKQEFFWKRKVEQKEDEAGPSTAIPVESSEENDKEFWGPSDEDEYWMP